MKDNRLKLEIKIDGAKRLFMWHFLNKKLDLILLSEFPKSGGSWFGQLLSETLNIPFPRNISPKFERCILHGHHLYHSNFNKVVTVLRDGRDTMVSSYYHFLFENDKNPNYAVKEWRKQLQFKDYDDIKTNLPVFIQFMFEKYKSTFKRTTWSSFVNSYVDNPYAIVVRYEDLLISPVSELIRVIGFLGYPSQDQNKIKLIVEKYSFSNQTKRKQGEENRNSFLRKGIAGDWKNHFSLEACLTFDKYAGKELIKAGYEKNHDWIKNYK